MDDTKREEWQDSLEKLLEASSERFSLQMEIARCRLKRSIEIEGFLARCTVEAQFKFKVLRKHIWRAAGHRSPRQFEYWQRCSDKATAQDNVNFRRILSQKP